jgi:ribonucleoside-diphosphate reductase alpha chain
MSDTVINRPSSKSKNKGLTIERLYTTAGKHPYDEVTWERRDVVQTNWKSGEVIFEQRGVEFPDFWSVNASTIVTTKYFRGAVGHENREWSLRQVIDRVVLTYVDVDAPSLLLQFTSLVQRRNRCTTTGQRLLHPFRR